MSDRFRTVALLWVLRLLSFVLFVTSVYVLLHFFGWSGVGWGAGVGLFVYFATPLNLVLIPWFFWTGLFLGFCPYCMMPGPLYHVTAVKATCGVCETTEYDGIGFSRDIPSGWTRRSMSGSDEWVVVCSDRCEEVVA